MRLYRAVVRAATRPCSWCRNALELDAARYVLAVGPVPLGPHFCTQKCAEDEARHRRRGPLKLVYLGGA